MSEPKVTEAQQRILDMLSDGRPHQLKVELEKKGHGNQHSAIAALERVRKIVVSVGSGYYSYWSLV